MIYAGFWRRLAAHFIDGLIVTIAMYAGMAIVAVMFGMSLTGIASLTPSNSDVHEEPLHEQNSSLAYRIIPVQHEMTVSAPYEQPSDATVDAAPNVDIPNADLDAGSTSSPLPEYEPATGDSQEDQSYSYEYEQSTSGELSPALAGAMFGMMAVFMVIAFLIGAAYHTFFVASRWQATPGKRVMGCMVVTKDGKRLSYMNAFGRHAACGLSWLPWPPISIGFFLIGWTSQKTGLHDMIAGTRVVRVANADPVIATR